ncbi:MAG: class I SAM-dependent methyltransferase [Thermomicrobiales bacterium]
MSRGDQGPSAEDRARSYDDDIRAAIPGYELLHETAAALLQNDLGENARVLLVGAGTGEEIVRLAPGNPGWHLIAVDPSAPMLAVARERVQAADLSDRVDLREGYVGDLPEGELFDAATMLLVMHFAPDDGAKLELLRSVSARLKLGAPLILADMHGDLHDPAIKRRYEAWKRRQIARGVAVADAEAMFAGLPQVVHFVPRERIEDLLREAGFVDIEPVFSAFVIGAWFARKAPGAAKST